MTSPIIKVKLCVGATRKFPLDVVYLTKQEHKPLLPRLFPWSLCTVLTAECRRILGSLQIDYIEKYSTTNRTTRDRSRTTIMRALEAGEFGTCTFLTVPILALTRVALNQTRVREEQFKVRLGRKQPAYLLAKEQRKREKPVLAVLTDDTVLFTPHGPVRPICTLCPRQMRHLQGDCVVGTQPCYDALILQEEEIREQLQDDGPDQDRAAPEPQT